MSEIEERKQKVVKSLFKWIVIFPIGVHIFMYLSEVITRFVFDLQAGNEIVLSKNLLGLSPDWNFFWTVILKTFPFSILLGLLAWIYMSFISKYSFIEI